jgi:hypothetical protein
MAGNSAADWRRNGEKDKAKLICQERNKIVERRGRRRKEDRAR